MHRQPIKLSFDPAACILIAGMLLFLPLQWVVAVVFSAAFHELCHILALRICGVRIGCVSVGAGGVQMEVAVMQPYKEAICALAGPVGGLSLLLFSRWIPRAAVCGAIHALYNLLPLYPMDGGRVLRCIVQMLCPMKGDSVFSAIQNIILVSITVLCVYACLFYGLGLLPMIFVALLWRKTKIHLANGGFYGYNSANLQKR